MADQCDRYPALLVSLLTSGKGFVLVIESLRAECWSLEHCAFSELPPGSGREALSRLNSSNSQTFVSA